MYPGFREGVQVTIRKEDALEECDVRDGLATSEYHCVWMGGREAHSRGCDLPDVVSVWILFNVSIMRSKPGGLADTFQMDSLEYGGVHGGRQPGPVKQCGRG